MRRSVFLPCLLAVVTLSMVGARAMAQEWTEFVNMEDRFGVNFPAPPILSDSRFALPSGATVPARTYTVVSGTSRYSVTVVRYAGVAPEVENSLLLHAASTITGRAHEVNYDGDAVYEGMSTRMIQGTNPDRSRSFIAITQPPETSEINRLYIVVGTTPAGSPPPGLFQQSLSIRDRDGARMRYATDIEGTKFRVIPDSGGMPLLRRMCADGLPCAER